MARLRIGVKLESFGVPFRRALQQAERLGVAGVQADAVGQLAPDALSQTGRRELRHLLRAHNLELAAVGCPLRRGLGVPDNQEARIEHVRKVLSLSFDLGPRLVVVQAGAVPPKPDDPSARWLHEALLALGHHGDRVGAALALETGLEPGETLAAYLARFDTGGLGVSFDPANLLLNGFDPYESVRALAGQIRYATAKDARRAGTSRPAREVPLGHGDLDWLQLLAGLEEADYHGWLTVVRDEGDRRAEDVAAGVAVLRRLGV